MQASLRASLRLIIAVASALLVLPVISIAQDNPSAADSFIEMV